jgi:hypothetical protein
MSSYLTYLLVQAQEADLAQRARRAPPRRVARQIPHPPGRLRTRTARLLVGLAHRLDDRSQPAAPRALPSGGGI